MVNKFKKITNMVLMLLLFSQIKIEAASYQDNDLNRDFVTYKFITVPKEKLSRLWPFLLKLVPALSFGIVADEVTVSLLENTDFFNNFLAYLLPNHFSRFKEKRAVNSPEDFETFYAQDITNLKYAIQVSSGLISGLTIFKVYFLIHNSLKNQYEKEALVEFLENWEIYKNKCPLDLKNYIETIHDIYIKNKKIFDQNYQEDFRAIKKKISEIHPESLYTKDKFISYFKLALQNFQIMPGFFNRIF